MLGASSPSGLSRNLYAQARQSFAAGQYATGTAQIRQALALDPALADAACGIGKSLLDARLLPEAEALYRAIAEVTPDHEPTSMGLGMALQLQMRAGDALSCFEQLITKNPNHKSAWVQKAAALETLNRVDEAIDTVNEARARFSDWTPSVLEARLLRRKGNVEAARDLLQPFLKTLREDKAENFPAFFEAGQIYEALDQPDQAFKCFSAGNRCMAASPAAKRLDLSAFPRQIEQHLSPFTAQWVEGWTQTPAYNDKPEPVFIVGFPRSGTTLLDQILYAHQDTAVAEEISALTAALNKSQEITGAPYPGNLATLNEDQIRQLRDAYFDFHRAEGADLSKPFLIDKHPLNMLRAGVIHRLFPGAKIILVLRHPYDCVLSCFMQSFTLNLAMVQFLDLKNAATLYNKVFDAWEKYGAALPLNIHIVRYEDLVSAFRPTMEKLLAFIGLPWCDDIMEYNKAAGKRGAIASASYAQVGAALSTRPAGRWRRYKRHLKAILPVLRPWAEKFGYDTE